MMLTEFLSLLCLGLCLGYEDEKNERLPKPFFSALPSSVVESKSNVTLKCWSTFQNATFRLGKLNNTGSEEQLKSAENNVELLLTDLEPKDAGKYFCTYKTTASQGWAESEHLQLVVTGCPEPLHIEKARKNQTDFVLWTVTSSDSDNYSCVYYQWNFPYLGFFPSKNLEIWVTDEDEYEGYEAPPIKTGGDENLGTLSSKQDSRIIFITVFSCLSMFLSFFSIFLIYRCVQYDSADEESTRRSSHSNFPNQEATDLSKPERTSLSAEDSEGNTRALCEAAYASY